MADGKSRTRTGKRLAKGCRSSIQEIVVVIEGIATGEESRKIVFRSNEIEVEAHLVRGQVCSRWSRRPARRRDVLDDDLGLFISLAVIADEEEQHVLLDRPAECSAEFVEVVWALPRPVAVIDECIRI